MKFVTKICLFSIIILLFGWRYSYSQTLSASDSAEKPKAVVADDRSWISNGKGLKRWWLKNAKKYDPLPNPVLYHFEGTYSYSEQGGNIDAKVHKGKIGLTLRKHLFTSITKYGVKNRNTDVSLTEKHIQVKDQFIRQGFHFAITDKISAVVGKSWEQNTAKYLEDRATSFGGFKFTILDSPKLDLTFGTFYADSKIAFMSSEIQKKKKYADFPTVDDYESDSLDFHQKLHWQITDTISFSEGVNYVKFLEDSKYYFWKLNFGLKFKLTKRTSFVTSYTINYDYNKFVESVQDYLDQRRASGQSAGNMETTDTELSVGIKFQF